MSYTNKQKNREYARLWYRRNKERLLNKPGRREQICKAAARWRAFNREAAMLSAAKSRAKREGKEFNLDASDIIIPDLCPILLIPLRFTGGRQDSGTPALDRRDNKKGYIKGNVFVISHKANRLKADLSSEDICRLWNYVKDLKNCA